MTDPHLQSVHLEGNARREFFREARDRAVGSLGSNTIVGAVRIPLGGDRFDMPTIAPADLPVRNVKKVGWIVDRGKQLPLKVGVNSVGRLPDNDVIIDDATVSRRHCAIIVHSDMTCELHELASKNGTSVNGHRLKGSRRLLDGDEIGLSEHRVTIVICAEGEQPDDLSLPTPDSLDDRTMMGN